MRDVANLLAHPLALKHRDIAQGLAYCSATLSMPHAIALLQLYDDLVTGRVTAGAADEQTPSRSTSTLEPTSIFERRAQQAAQFGSEASR